MERLSRRRVFLAVGLAALATVGIIAVTLVVVLPHYHLGHVESISGGIATVDVAELNAEFTAEVVDPDLAPDAGVVLYIAEGEASIVVTSPKVVAFVAILKELL